MPNTYKISRRLVLSGALCLSVAACDGGGKVVGDLLHHRARTTLLIVDASGSTRGDRAIYTASIQAVVNTLQAGDRLVVAQAGDQDRGEVRMLLDMTVPNSNIRLDREAGVAAARAQVERAVPTLVPESRRPGTHSTLLLAAIAAGAQAFGSAPRDGDRLVICSDGIEEGPAVNLARMTDDPAAISAAINNARKAGLVPALDGVEMTVAGAGGNSDANYIAIEKWWRAYAAAAHLTLVNYGRLPFRAPA